MCDNYSSEPINVDIFLKPCPFCGSGAYCYIIPPHKHMSYSKTGEGLQSLIPDYAGGAFVECYGCDVGYAGESPEDVAAKWNRRAE